MLNFKCSGTAMAVNSFTHCYCNSNILLLIKFLNAIVLIPHDSRSAEIKVNNREVLVGFILFRDGMMYDRSL